MNHRIEGVGTNRRSLIARKMLTYNKRQFTENMTGRTIAMVCAALLVIVVLSITYFIASKGLSTFFV
ncbi:phosphate ABC transporter permease subunit PstC, partial [Mesorhizobium sp. M00.F.Ca.ET.186.01.1.1]